MSDKVDKAIQKIKQISKDMIKEWRPDDWEPLDCEKCQCRESRCETWCQLYRTYEDSADAMLIARDKWWVAKAFSLLDKLAPTGYSAEDAFTIRKFIEQLKREVGQ